MYSVLDLKKILTIGGTDLNVEKSIVSVYLDFF